MSEIAVWLIFFLPLLSFVLIAAARPFMGSNWRGAGYITVAALTAAFLLSLALLIHVAKSTGHDLGFAPHDWLAVGPLNIQVGIIANSLTAIMAVVVTGVSLLVQICGQEYMRGETSYTRYYAYMSLFTASMLGLILASNLIFIYVFWELVGLSSYLLIGFWSIGKGAEEHPNAANAAKKAFIVTRLGDLGFLAAILWAFAKTGTFDVGELQGMVVAGTLGGAALTWLCLGIFAGAVGKSGQFPLHVWLPDAMEGPTPVSALIHAATMVAAGVFLVARVYPLFEASDTALTFVAWIGGGTAAFAATMALVSNDIKRVLAYSTVSQLGYMMLALGLGSPTAAIFHLFAHAYFKALLFLGAGSIHHAVHTYDMRYMGGLRKAMPVTFFTMLIGSLALVGVFPLAGFWSKDAILHAASINEMISGAGILYILATITAGLTGFYVFRMFFMTFGGKYRGGAAAESGHAHDHTGHGPEAHLHESPPMMILPLVILAVPAALAGLTNLPGEFLGIPHSPLDTFLGGEHETFSIAVAFISSVVGALGIALAYSMYVRGTPAPSMVGARLRPAYVLLANRYYMDTLYEQIITGKLLYRFTGGVLEFVDTHIVDRSVNTVGWLGRSLGRLPSAMENGQVQLYGTVVSIGLILILGAIWIWG